MSVGHYIETWRAASDDRRRRLAEVMISLSKGLTLASSPTLCDNELDDLLVADFGVARVRPPWPALGLGFPHAAGLAIPPLPFDPRVEREHLAARPDGFTDYGRGHQDFGDLYRDGEQNFIGRSELGVELHESAIAGSAVMEIHENVAWALERAQLPVDALGPIGFARPDLPDAAHADLVRALLPVAREFISRLPTREAALRVRLLRHEDGSAHWEANDMIDIAYLSAAVVHTNAIVTERQWVHMLGRSGLLEEHQTIAIADAADLPDVIRRLSD